MEYIILVCVLIDCVLFNNWNKISRVDGLDDLRESEIKSELCWIDEEMKKVCEK